MRKKIIRNRIKCNYCKDIIESMDVHDFKWYKCGKAAVDGEKDYLRRCGDLENITELSECED